MPDFSELHAIMTNFHFIRPWWWLAIIPFGVLFFYQWKETAQPESWQKRLPEHLRSALTVGESGWKGNLPIIALLVIVFFVVAVCAGPTWKRETSPLFQNKTPLVVVLDSGTAMLEKDIAPDRITRAKQKIEDILSTRTGGLNALIVYSGSAHMAMPLTEDTAVFKPMLEAIGPDIMPVQGRDSAAAIPYVEQQLANNPVPGTVLLITSDVNAQSVASWRDYFERSGSQPLSALPSNQSVPSGDQAMESLANAESGSASINNRSAKAQLVILAAGNAHVPSDIPLKLDALTQFASEANGSVVEMSIDDEDVKTIIRKVDNHAAFNQQGDEPWEDMGYVLLLPIMLCLLLWFRRGWLVQWAWIGVMVNGVLLSGVILGGSLVGNTAYALPVHSVAEQTDTTKADKVNKAEEPTESFIERLSHSWMNLWLTPDQQGQWYFNRGEYLKAAERYDDPLRKGVAFYYASQFSSSFKVLNQSDDFEMQLNAASALARQREYVKTRTLLRSLVKQNPDDKVAKHNLHVVEKLIEEINRFSASQDTGDDGAVNNSKELGDAPQTADGAEAEVSKEQLIEEKLTAEELLSSDSVIDKWMERIETTPKAFLRSKFAIQHANGPIESNSNQSTNNSDQQTTTQIKETGGQE